MNKLTKAQRDQLIGIAMGAVMLMGALWYFGVTAKNTELTSTKQKSSQMEQKLHSAEALMKQEDQITGTLQSRGDLLSKREATLAPDRDAYAWLIDLMNNFIQSRKGVNIDTYSQPEIADNGPIPAFPYRWATFHLKGSGYYQDLGKFFSDFENNFPYFQIQNLTLAANSSPGMDAEKLTVTFDLVAPVAASSSDTK